LGLFEPLKKHKKILIYLGHGDFDFSQVSTVSENLKKSAKSDKLKSRGLSKDNSKLPGLFIYILILLIENCIYLSKNINSSLPEGF